MTQGSSSSYEDIINLIMDNVSVRDIARRLGRNELATRRLVNQLVVQYGLTYIPIDDDMPYGMTDQSAKLRIYLGSKLYDLRQQLGGDRTKVSSVVGLNRREQLRAEQRPYSHNWSISQIERLALSYSKTITEFLSDAM